MFARTERLMLRPGWLEDAPALVAALGDRAVSRNLSRVPYPYREEDAHAYLAQPRDLLHPQFLVFTRTRGAPRLVGGCGLSLDTDGVTEIGYWIARAYWGLGFATEAGKAVMNIARATGIDRLRAYQAVDNPASGKVLRKIGFRETGRVEGRYSAARGTTVPCLIFEPGEDVEIDDDPMMAMLEEQDRLIAA